MSSRYGFYGRLKAEFPSQVLVDVAEVCNLACVHCPHSAFRKSRHYKGRFLDRSLNAKLVEEVRRHGQNITRFIRYSSNGEPLLHSHIFEMLEYAKRRSGVTVALTTNGTLMKRPWIERLLSIGVDLIDVSIDAFSCETYAKIRMPGDLRVTRDNVFELIEGAKQAGSKTKVVVSYVEQPQNKHETLKFKNFWEENGADFVIIRPIHSCSGAKKELADLRRSQNSPEKRRPCVYPWERIVLNARGDLAFCPSDWVHRSCVADYSESTIHEVWQGQAYRRLREAHLTNDFSRHKFCAQCPDWRLTVWPGKGTSYADMMAELNGAESAGAIDSQAV